MNDTFAQAGPTPDGDSPSGPGLLASGYFWVGGVISGEVWAVVALWAFEFL